MHELNNVFDNITDPANTRVAWLSHCAKRNVVWKMLKYNRYNDFLKALDSSSKVREMIKLHHSAQQRKTQATKKLRDLWQHSPEVQEILSVASGSEKWMRSSEIAIERCTDPGLVKRFLLRALVKRLTMQNRKTKANKWYTSRDIQEAKKFLDNDYLLLEEGIDYDAISLKSYWGLVMPVSYYPGMDNRNHTN
jgi:hypothetical protein